MANPSGNSYWDGESGESWKSREDREISGEEMNRKKTVLYVVSSKEVSK